MLVWYHGPLPVDYIGLVSQIYLDKERRVYSVVDRCLAFMPMLQMFREHLRWDHVLSGAAVLTNVIRIGSYSKVQLVGLLDRGELVGVAPGGGRECLFDRDSEVLWNKR